MINDNQNNSPEPSFARVLRLSDVLAKPIVSADPITLNSLRETQALLGSVVRVFEVSGDFTSVELSDGVRGWLFTGDLSVEPSLTSFVKSQDPELTGEEFFKKYEGAPYLSGGLSPAGIDCSGLIQRYYLEVHDKRLPRNSRQQRALSPERAFGTVQNGDLVFALEKENGRHHVGLYLYLSIWHTDSREGVVRHPLARFEELYDVEAVITLR